MKIKYIEGDLFEAVKGSKDNIVIAHVCNCRGGFGSGFVVPLAKHFPVVREEYKQSFVDGECVLGHTQFVQVTDTAFVANMIAQTLGGPRPLYYNHLATCMDAVAKFCVQTKSRIMAPLFGAGLAGGDWLFIEQLVYDAWIKSGLDVTIHYLPATIDSGLLDYVQFRISKTFSEIDR